MVRIGMLTPSSNTVLEPVTASLLKGLSGVSAHFSRIRVTHISLDDASGAQFAAAPMLAAASLLADALVDVIVWNGTSGSWLGLAHDRELCKLIQEETGIPATTSSLAMLEAYGTLHIRRIGLVTPYTTDVNTRIIAQYEETGLQCPISVTSGLKVNEQFANVPPADIANMIDEAAAVEAVDGIAIVCTNFAAAGIVAGAESKHGKPVLDSVSVTAWHALRLCGVDCRPLSAAWGRLFAVL